MKYEMIWRNKWLTSDAKTLDDMISLLQNAVNELKEMKEAGITLENTDGISDDYALFTTTDEKIAERFGFSEIDEDFEDEDN